MAAKRFNRIVAFLMCLLITATLAVFAFPASAAGSVSRDRLKDKTTVAEDLSTMKVGGILDATYLYPYMGPEFFSIGENPTLKVIAFGEYGYSEVSEGDDRYQDYALYLYLYNPHDQNVTINNNWSKITMGINGGELKKYPLILLSKGGPDGHENVWLKYKVGISPEDLRAAVGDSSERVYDVAEFEIPFYGLSICAYKLGGTYTYTGFMEGYGADPTVSTIEESVKDFMTLDLECHAVTYREKKNMVDDGLYTQLDSVYFTIPNSVIEEYGSLSGASYSYYEYNSGDCLGLVADKEYDIYKPLQGVETVDNTSVDSLSGQMYYRTDFVIESYCYSWAFNQQNLGLPINRLCTNLSYVFKYSDKLTLDDFIQTGLQEYVDQEWEDYNNGVAGTMFAEEGTKESHYVTNSVDNRNSEDWYSFTGFNSNKLNFWEKLFNWNENGYTNSNVQPIQTVTDADLSDIEGKLFVNEAYKAELTAALAAATKAGETLQLLHFAESEYFTTMVNRHELLHEYQVGFVANEQLYLDFDVISLTFAKDGVDTILGVVMEPINIVPDLQSPGQLNPKNDGGCRDIDFSDVPKWVWVVLLVLVLLIAFPIVGALAPVLKLILEAIVLVITLPFRILAWIFNLFRRR